MTPGFVRYWADAMIRPGSPEYAFARKRVDTPKVVFSGAVDQMGAKNVPVENGDLVQAVVVNRHVPRKAGA